MLHPPTASPSRGARPPKRPGAVVLLVAALAAVLGLAVTLTAHGSAPDRDPRAASPARATSDTPAQPDAGPAGGRADTPYGTQDTPGQHPSAAHGESASPLPPRTPSRTATPHPSRPAASPGAAESGTARPSARPRAQATRRTAPAPKTTPYDGLRVGDCFDIDRDAPGTVARRGCDTPHDAELVARLHLTGRHVDDGAVRDAAAALCRGPLRLKAADQPLGTRWTTFVQYPYRTSYLLGSDTVACSLAAPSGSGRKLTAPLQ
ncbi:hypothetical protein ACIGEZ_18640 [Streptomyces sp. NPDC085481]|uniref:hypothetical protein n=1 Tax=Streptomyces sp. NPDC085481 TaxID=3365727 RepID=UPI0037D7ED85